jgi:hypothetical protein
VQTNLEEVPQVLVKFVSTKEWQLTEKIKVIDKDISDFSVDRTKRDWEIKIDWTMTNNLLEETLDELIKAWNRQIHVLQILQSTSFSHIHRNREAISFKICIVQSYVLKHVSLPKAFIEASNKSNIVIYITLFVTAVPKITHSCR